MPVSAPFQPEWAAPMTPALLSANSSTPQSAPVTPKAEARRRRDQPVAARPFALGPRRRNRQGVGGMDLIGHKKVFRRDAERARHAGAVFRHGGRIVAASRRRH